MPRYQLTIAYDGTNFNGWQKQKPGGAVRLTPLRTVQAVVEQAVREVVHERVGLIGASRTDSGVHAIGQVAAFSTESPIPPERMAMAINSRLPDDVQVREAIVVHDDFDPIQHCVSKGYRYRLKHGKRGVIMPPLFDRFYVYWMPHLLCVDRMQEAAAHFVGNHDFASVTKAGHGRESTVRTIHECSMTIEDEHHCHMDVSGDGFLYNMVRIIAGTLVAVGRGHFEPGEIPEIIEACDRRAAGPTLPSHGLSLQWIEYPNE